MARRLKLLSGLTTIAAVGALALGGCGKRGDDGAEGAEGEGSEGAAAAVSSVPHAHGGEGEGEGEGAEAPDASLAHDKPAYLAQLMMLRGHLKAGTALYVAGEGSLAAAHMKHPQDELYATLKPAIEAYGARDIGEQLSDLAASVEGGMPVERVEEAFANVRAVSTAAIEASKPELKDILIAASLTLNQAGAEYEAAVTDGRLINAKEYQDAYGFMATVVEALGAAEGETEAEKAAVAVAREHAALAFNVAPTLAPAARLEGKSSTIYGAATRIEIAARALD